MTRVVAPSRLHFGLLSLPPNNSRYWGELPVRQFGGVGLMIDSPGVVVSVEHSDQWSVEGPTRALEFARDAAALVESKRPGATSPLRVVVENCPREHVGLGVGTQLALSCARAVSREFLGDDDDLSVYDLAAAVRRGERSMVGVHGFARGGVIVEAGKGPSSTISPMIARWEFPEEWRIVLARPVGVEPRWFGTFEREVFARPRDDEESVRLCERMCRTLMLGALPSLAERDCRSFGQAIQEYNLLAGRIFRAEQGGDYSSPEVTNLIEFAARNGAHGAGQSSWGPTVFAFCEDEDAALRLHDALLRAQAGSELRIVRGDNRGARLS